jgi:hypothetical protein
LPQSEAERKASLKYRKDKRKQLVLDMSIEEYEAISRYCDNKGINKATWVKGLIRDNMSDKGNNELR